MCQPYVESATAHFDIMKTVSPIKYSSLVVSGQFTSVTENIAALAKGSKVNDEILVQKNTLLCILFNLQFSKTLSDNHIK